MSLIDPSYLVTSALISAVAMAMVWLSVRAYRRTPRPELIALSIGFCLIVAGTAATAIGGLLTGFTEPRRLLLVYAGFTALGCLLLVYSVYPLGRGPRGDAAAGDGR